MKKVMEKNRRKIKTIQIRKSNINEWVGKEGKIKEKEKRIKKKN